MTTTPTHTTVNGTRKILEACLSYAENSALVADLSPPGQGMAGRMLFLPGPAAEHTIVRKTQKEYPPSAGHTPDSLQYKEQKG